MEKATHRIAFRACDGAVGLLTMEELEKFGPVQETTTRPFGGEIQGWVDENEMPIFELFDFVRVGTHPVWLSVKRYPATKQVKPVDRD